MRDKERELRIADGVRSIRPRAEREALDRAVALAAETASGVRPRASRRRRRAAIPLAAGLAAAAALALTPAGAAVRDWIDDAVDPPAPTRTTLGPIPGGGELVVQSRTGPWVVRDDGSRRRLGDYDAAAWSPHGIYLAVADGSTLSAVEPDGDARWSIDAPGEVRDPRWSASGQRVAYRAGTALRVTAGDGTGDRALGEVAPEVAPAWMPASDPYARNVLAYVRPGGSVRVTDVDSGGILASAHPPERPIAIAWLDRDRLLLTAAKSLRVLDVSSERIERLRPPGDGSIAGTATSPDGSRIVALTEIARKAGPPQVTAWLAELGPARPARASFRTLFTGIGRFQAPQFSPDGSRMLLGWRDADQWLFFDVTPSVRRGKPIAIGDVARQFDPGAPRDAAAFPRVTGWCCG